MDQSQSPGGRGDGVCRPNCRLALCVTGARLLALITPALATDLLSTSSTTWQGFYVGGALGGAWSDTDWRYDNHNWFNTIGPDLVGTGFNIDTSGILGGGQPDLITKPDRG